MYVAKSKINSKKWAVFTKGGAEKVGTTKDTEEEAQKLVDVWEAQEEEMRKKREELKHNRN